MPSSTARGAAVVGLSAVLFVVALGVFRQKDRPPPADPAPRRDDPPPPPAPDGVRYDEKLVYKPTPVPDRVVLTWKGDPAASQAVTWRTDTSVKGPVGQIALADDGPGVEPGWRGYEPKKVTKVPARTERVKTAANEALYHSVNFEGLRPNTRYVYRVGDGANWSEWFQFATASDRPEPFGFIYFGDAQNGVRSLWSRVARGAYSDMPKARFIVHAGDLIDFGPSDTQWGEWHAAAGWINGMVPSVPTPGNHEYIGGLTPHWRAQFTLPENGPPGLEETCYYFDFQGTRVVCLNSNEKHPEQAKWAARVLADNPNRWTVVTFHHPVYSPAPGRDNEALRKAWRPVFDAAPKGVDLVLQGHDHTYGRSGLMLGDNTLSGGQAHTARGTVYVVSISGAKMYTAGEKSWMVRKASGLQLYQLIRIDGDRLTYEARTAKGDLYDAFELRKRAAGGNDMVEKDTPLPPEAEAGPESAAPGAAGVAATDRGDRTAWNAVAAVLILGLVATGIGWALRRR